MPTFHGMCGRAGLISSSQKCQPILVGISVDILDGMRGQGFPFHNPAN